METLMKSLIPVVAAGIFASTMTLSPALAQSPAVTPAAPAAASSSFDAYQALAITAGVVGGAVVAVVVTDGLIIPAYAWATGAGGGGMAAGAGGGMGAVGGMEAAGVAGMGAETVMVGMSNGIQTLGHGGYAVLRGGMRVLGAVSGGLIANSWYTGG